MKIKRQFSLLNLTGIVALLLVTTGVFWMWFMLSETYALQQSLSQAQSDLIMTINQVIIEFKYDDSEDQSFVQLIGSAKNKLAALDNLSIEAQTYQTSILTAIDSVVALYSQLAEAQPRNVDDITKHLEDKLLFQLHALFDDTVVLTQLIVNDSYLQIRQFGLWAISAVLLASLIPVMTHRSISLKLNYTVRTIQTTLRQVKSGDFNARSSLVGHDELVHLAAEIDDMIAKLQQVTVSKVELETIVQERTAALQKLSYTDNLTGIANRRSLMEHGAREFARARRTNRAMSLIMLDLDYFKRVNDSIGHERGDWALRAVCKIINEQLRAADLFARLGGEEFVVLLSDTELEGAIELAERIRLAVELRFKYEAHPALKLTISIGVAGLNDCDASSLDELIFVADKQLYMAKKAGRNCVRPALANVTTKTQIEG